MREKQRKENESIHVGPMTWVEDDPIPVLTNRPDLERIESALDALVGLAAICAAAYIKTSDLSDDVIGDTMGELYDLVEAWEEGKNE